MHSYLTLKNIESGMKNLTDEQVKQQFHPFVESVARRQPGSDGGTSDQRRNRIDGSLASVQS